MDDLKKLEEQMLKALDNKTNLTISIRLAYDKDIQILKNNRDDTLNKIEDQFNELKEAYIKQRDQIKNKLIIN